MQALPLPPSYCMECGLANDRAFLPSGLGSLCTACCFQGHADTPDLPPGPAPATPMQIQTVVDAFMVLRAAHQNAGPQVAPMLPMLAAPPVAEQGDHTHEYDRIIDYFLNNPDQHNSEFDRVYSPERRSYGLRGGCTYFKPAGWTHFGIRVPDYESVKDWAVAYHGTTEGNILPILMQGLRRPGDPGVEQQHGGAGNRGRPTIYVSPSVCLSAHPVYSNLFMLRPGHYAQIVFKCRVRPGNFRTQRNTLRRTYWDPALQMDPDHADNESLEWLLEDPQDVRVTGLLLREFGPQADESRYGDLVKHVVEPFGDGPEYKWTELLQADRRRCGHYVQRVGHAGKGKGGRQGGRGRRRG